MKPDEEMPNPVFLDLKPNHLLLDPKFDGYKLSLDPLPMYIQPLSYGVDKAGPTDNQYSIQHAKIFGLYNCLHADQWNNSVFFVVDRGWAITKIYFDPQNNKFGPLEPIWTIPTESLRQTGRYNVTISFPNDQYAVLSDGCRTLFLLETGNRMENDRWKILKQQVFDEQSMNNLDQFIILDSKVFQPSIGCLQMDVLLLKLRDENEKPFCEFLRGHDSLFVKMTAKHPLITTLRWISFKTEDNVNWDQKAVRTLVGPSGVDYACVEPEGTGLLIASENHFAFCEISDVAMKYGSAKVTNLSEGPETKPDYLWIQNDQEVTIWLKVPVAAHKRDIHVHTKPSSISLTYNGKLMLEGEVLNPVKPEATVWTIKPAKIELGEDEDEDSLIREMECKVYQCLEIVFQKAEPNVNWEGESVIKGNCLGQQMVNPDFVANVHQNLLHLCSDKWNANPLRMNVCDPQMLEECDDLPADTTSFMRIDLEQQCISHLTSLGGHQWLFSTKVQDSQTPAICIRHDVDGILWLPSEVTKASPDISWKLEHFGTFSAMGYVQASKEQRKFTVCAPDLSYVAICDSVKHIYIYRQPNPMETDLRNRMTGKRVTHISKQQILSIDPPVEILGAHASNDFLYILTSQNIHAVRIRDVSSDE